jgi:tetratricopeptide (TPR) repeat protein
LEKRVYQASTGAVYPHPVIESIKDTKEDKKWEVIYLENEYLKIMIIPALGGRIQMAYDKIRERHFIYYNQVIKPALVGLTGPWISGGIEFNWPQHHRPSTYDPVEHFIEKNDDGSITVWVSEVERMFRTKGMAGFTLYPDKAYLEIKAKLYNRTPQPQTFLWWANPAVKVNDHYQSVFPPDVHAVFDHGKRDVSEFPIAKGTYYKVDYSPGTDISRYKNIPVPTSYMAITSEYDFVGGYENDSKGGLLHVANHHISPGKKQWTWGNGDFGRAWDRNLTDEDGPYIELMCGVYTDNQPDFAWMHPYEEKSFEQYFMPYYNVGVVKNASKEALVNMEIIKEDLLIKCHVTAAYPQAKVYVQKEGKQIFEEIIDLYPGTVYERCIPFKGLSLVGYKISIIDKNGKSLVSYEEQEKTDQEAPEPAKAIGLPEDIESIEQLYLSGLHLEQYRHATYNPTDYYEEALRRDPGDVRNNTSLGLWYLRRGLFEKSTTYFRMAIHRLTGKNPNPNDGAPYFHLGIALWLSGKEEEAFACFYKSTWNAAWQDAAFFHLAQIQVKRGNLEDALKLATKALDRNQNHHKAIHLQAAVLRKLGKYDEALKVITKGKGQDYFSYGLHYEQYLISQDPNLLTSLKELIEDRVHNYLEFSLDYGQMGLYKEAQDILNIYIVGKKQVYPLAHYYLGYFFGKSGNEESALKHLKLAEKMPKDYCFPNRLEEINILNYASYLNSEDGNAPYYLGNFWYANRQYELAKSCWEQAASSSYKNAICHRNLALLYYNKDKDTNLAQKQLDKAISIDQNSARLLMEYDQFNKKQNLPLEKRKAILDSRSELVVQRDDLYLEKISLLNIQEKFEEARELLKERTFNPWEGGEGKAIFQYLTSTIELGKKQIYQGDYEKAIKTLQLAKSYPACLGEGKIFGTQENDIDFWIGYAYDLLGLTDKAAHFWKMASRGPDMPSPAVFYNDQQPDKLFYKGLALQKLDEKEAAKTIFNNLVGYGKEHLGDDVKLDYFAISLPDLLIWEEDLSVRNNILCNYLIGLGYLGLGNKEKAMEYLQLVLEKDLYHIPAKIHLDMASLKKKFAVHL